MNKQLRRLEDHLHAMERVVIAYSGGVDSTLLLKLAHDCLGEDVVAVTMTSPLMPAHEQDAATALAREIGVRQILIKSRAMSEPAFRVNSPNRCYACKGGTCDQLLDYAQQEGYRAVLDGANADDLSDHRPGQRAARERGVRSPLQEVGLTKAEIRRRARALGLPNWNKPSAACLASRIPYGTPITRRTLTQIEEAEAVLRSLGFDQLRVRHHDPIARIEVSVRELDRALGHRAAIVAALRQLGYRYVTLDLSGFRSGSMNEGWVSDER